MLSADIKVPWTKKRAAAPEFDELLKIVSKPKQAAKVSRGTWQVSQKISIPKLDRGPAEAEYFLTDWLKMPTFRPLPESGYEGNAEKIFSM